MSGPSQTPTASTWDLSPPRRPGLTDFNNAAKIDDALQPPDPLTMPNSLEWNLIEKLEVAMGQMIPSAEVSVAAGASPSITQVASPCSAVNGILASFQLTRNAAGDYWVETTSGATAIPSTIGQPRASLNVQLGAHSYSIGAIYGTGPHALPAVRVTTTQDGVLTDLNFTCIFR